MRAGQRKKKEEIKNNPVRLFQILQGCGCAFRGLLLQGRRKKEIERLTIKVVNE